MVRLFLYRVEDFCKKVLLVFAGIAAAMAAAFLLTTLYLTLVGEMGIRQAIIDSSADRVFYSSFMLGVAGLYASWSWKIYLTKTIHPFSGKPSRGLLVLVCASTILFAIGWTYIFPFGSPW